MWICTPCGGGQGWGRAVATGCELRTSSCQSLPELIPICAGTQVKALGGAYLGRVRQGAAATVPSGLVRFKNDKGNPYGATLYILYTVTCI